jgi:hypothetical protein
MLRPSRFCLIALVVSLPATAADPPAKKGTHAVATVESTLTTADGHIRQFALDGDPDTFFASEKKPGKDDHFTVKFDRLVTLKSLELLSGRPTGEDALDSGEVLVSADGKAFTSLGRLTDGALRGKSASRVKVLRIKPGERSHALVIREIKVDTYPPVAVFKYPVEIVLDVSEAPDLKEFGEKVVRICEGAYPMINDELASDGFKPPTLITLTLQKDYRGVGVAQVIDKAITASAPFFRDHPNDVGAMIHETTHIVQRYRLPNNPGWLVEGIADYIRYFKFEPGKGARISPDRAKYDASYGVSAAFLDYVARKFDKDLVKKVNKALREGEYKEELWKELTKKTVQQLEKEWQASLKK